METDETAAPIWNKWHDESEPIRVGISACLLGAEVRFDGGHKRDRYLTDVLGDQVEWVPICPEIEAGLGIPRPVIQLRGGECGDRVVVRGDGTDLTNQMRSYNEERVRELREMGLDGFVFKRGSPSCGMERVRVYPEDDGPMPTRTGVGLFAQELMQGMPGVAFEEEGRLNDAPLRERFIEAIFSYNRLRVLERRGLTRGRLVAFHEAHKMLILAHDEGIYRDLGRVVASFGRVDDEEVYASYRKGFVAAFKETANPARHVNVLEHLFGHLKEKVNKREKREIKIAIQDYRAGRLPLVVPVSLLRFLVVSHDVEYVAGQLYLEPHPKEMMLRNHV